MVVRPGANERKEPIIATGNFQDCEMSSFAFPFFLKFLFGDSQKVLLNKKAPKYLIEIYRKGWKYYKRKFCPFVGEHPQGCEHRDDVTKLFVHFFQMQCLIGHSRSVFLSGRY